MDSVMLNKILLALVIIQGLVISGFIGYHIGSNEPVDLHINIEIPIDNTSEETNTEAEEQIEQEVSFEPVVIAEPEPIVKKSYTEEDVIYLAKTVWGEARGCNDTQRSAVVWTVLNRFDDGRWGDTIIDVITRPDQFVGYRASNPVQDDIKELVIDVLDRWEREKAGETDVGRTLPKGYFSFYGDGTNNHFTKMSHKEATWNWSLGTPY